MHQLQHHLLIKQGASLFIIIFDKTELSYVQWIEKKKQRKKDLNLRYFQIILQIGQRKILKCCSKEYARLYP